MSEPSTEEEVLDNVVPGADAKAKKKSTKFQSGIAKLFNLNKQREAEKEQQEFEALRWQQMQQRG